MQACETYAPGDEQCTCVKDAIFTHDSSWMTAGVGKRFNNPCNVRCLSEDNQFNATCAFGGVSGWFAKFERPEDGIAACVELYARKYRGMEADALVAKWATTNYERNPGYFDSVRSCY